MLYACDAKWWVVYGEEAARTTNGEFWSSCDVGGGHRNGNQFLVWDKVADVVMARLNLIEVADDCGLCTKPGRIHSGGNSGYQAMNLAFMWGAAKIVLMGFDFQRTNGKAHNHGNHEGGLTNLTNDLEAWRGRMIPMAADLRSKGVRVINASRETAITCIERMTPEQALC